MKGEAFARLLQLTNLRWFLRKILHERAQLPSEEEKNRRVARFLPALEKYLQKMETWVDKKVPTAKERVGTELVIDMSRDEGDLPWTDEYFQERNSDARHKAGFNEVNCPRIQNFPIKEMIWDHWLNRTAENVVLNLHKGHAPVANLNLHNWKLNSALQGMGLMKSVISTAIVMCYRSVHQQKITIQMSYLPTTMLVDSFWAVAKTDVDTMRFAPELSELYWSPAVYSGGVAWDYEEFNPPDPSNLVWTPASLRAEMRYTQAHNQSNHREDPLPHVYGKMLHNIEHWVATNMHTVTKRTFKEFEVLPPLDGDDYYSNTTWHKVSPFYWCILGLEMVDDLDEAFFAPLIKMVPYHSRKSKTRLPVLSLWELRGNCRKSNALDYTNQLRIFVAFLVDIARDLGLPLVLHPAVQRAGDETMVTRADMFPAVLEMQICREDRVKHLSLHSPERYHTWPMKEWSWPTDVGGMGPAPVFVRNEEKDELWFYPQPKARTFAIPTSLVERVIKQDNVEDVTFADVLSCVKPVVEQEEAPIPLLNYLSPTKKRAREFQTEDEPLPKEARLKTSVLYPCTHCASHGAELLDPQRPLEIFCNQHCYNAYQGQSYDPF